MKKISCIIVSAIMLFSAIAPLVSYANTGFGEDQADLIQEDVFVSSYSPSSLSLNEDTLNNLKETIYNSLINCSSKIFLSTYRITNDEFQIIYTNVINDNPNLFYVSSSYSFSYNSSTNYITSITPEYVMSKSEIDNAKIIYENGVNKALSQVNSSMTDIQKALVIHDYLANISTYPDLGTNNVNDKPSYHSAYGIYLDGYTVCAGYTLTYSDLMHRLGIESKYVISEGMSHAWNVIKIGDNWYNVDLTFDEIQFVSGTNNKGTILHNCFLKSDEGIQSSEGIGHYDITYPEGVECNDTSYDNYFWHGVNTNIYVINDDYYYLDFDNTTKNVDIIKRDINGNETKLNNNEYKSYSVSSSSSTNVGIVKYIIPFSKLIKINDVLYFSYVDNGAKIGAYDTKNSVEYPAVLSHDSYNFGLDVNNGIISYSTYADRYNYIEFNQLETFNETYPIYNIYVDKNKDNYVNAKDYVYITK